MKCSAIAGKSEKQNGIYRTHSTSEFFLSDEQLYQYSFWWCSQWYTAHTHQHRQKMYIFDFSGCESEIAIMQPKLMTLKMCFRTIYHMRDICVLCPTVCVCKWHTRHSDAHMDQTRYGFAVGDAYMNNISGWIYYYRLNNIFFLSRSLEYNTNQM